MAIGIDVLLGKILREVLVSDDEIIFHTICGRSFRMVYHPDCCASCNIESIVGDVSDLLGTPVHVAEEVVHSNETPADLLGPPSPFKEITEGYYPESYSWTFYKIDTWRGGVTIRWYGSSNGYYSETATFEEITKGEDRHDH